VIEYLIDHWRDVVFSIGILASGIALGFCIYFVMKVVNKRLKWGKQTIFYPSLKKHEKGPVKFLIPLIIISIFIPFTKFPPEVVEVLHQILRILFTIAISWVVIKSAFVIEDLILSRYKIEERDNLQARKLYTQIQFLKRAVIIAVGVIALALILMQFTQVKQLGTTILASAGIIGIVLGIAAQRTIGTFIAGLQIAITQPIRIDDVVIVENEWGRIEEITLTYVVVKIWDLRRLVLPITYFIEKPFQNWTRTSADILGTVFLYADYTIPVQAIREELYRLLEKSSLWDGKVWNLQVTKMNDRTVELRALMSAPDASMAWNLRCEIREKLLDFMQRNYQHCLPHLRTQLQDVRLDTGG
jgi:small-conductance mechanosensitive channel